MRLVSATRQEHLGSLSESSGKPDGIGVLRTCMRSLGAAAIAGLVMSIFEADRMALLPTIGMGASYFAMILFASLMVAAISFSILDKDARRRLEMQSNEMRYRLLFWKSLTGAYRTTLDGQILDCNVAFCRVFGYAKRDDVMNKSIGFCDFSQTDRAEFIKRLQTEKEVTNLEQCLRRKDGSAIWVLNSAALVANEVGEGLVIKGTMTDITERVEAQQENRRLADIVRCSDDSIVSISMEGIIQTWNAGAERTYGYGAAEVLGRSISILVPGDLANETNEILAMWKSGCEVRNLELVRVRKDGQQIVIQLTISPTRDLTGNVVGASTVARDVTDKKRAEESLLFKTALLEAATETSIDGILAVDESGNILLANTQFSRCFGVSEELLRTRDDSAVLNHLKEMVKAPYAFLAKIEYLYAHRDEKSMDEIKLKNGRVFERYSAPLIDSEERYRGRIWYFRDITERKAAEERIAFLAYYDALTGLPHRALLQDRLDRALAEARRRNERVALLFVDLDRFKEINDSFGHSFGDVALRDAARRIKDCAREQDTVARVDGDEFLILMNGVRNASDAAIAAERIIKAMKQPFMIEGQSLSLGCSIGVSVFPENGVDAETLIKNADSAMYSAKDSGRKIVRFFTDEMNTQALERVTLENSLRLALEQDEFFLVYQPQLEIESGRIIGFEALIRWQHPELGLVPPDRFITIAENNGLILPIGEWVLRTACTEARRWQDECPFAVPVAVNVSAVQFRQVDFPDIIRNVLRETRLLPQYLELELTESSLLSNAGSTISVLQEFKEMGLKLAIDDFGTGYSSLSYLNQFAVDKLKIDRSFIREIDTDRGNAAITSAIISMAKSLHLKVIAEGVESESQMSLLREQQCDEIQGYYFSKPVSADEAAAMLHREWDTCGFVERMLDVLGPQTSLSLLSEEGALS